MTSSRTQRKSAPEEPAGLFGLRALNVALLVGGLAAIILGYVLLSTGSVVAAPLLLFFGYAVLIPAGLLVGFRGRGDD
jgi:hypothetical protein